MNCPICGSTLILSKNLPAVKDHFKSGQTFTIKQCSRCDLQRTSFEDIDKISDYYESSEYASHGINLFNPIHLVYSIVRRITLFQKRRILEQYKRPKTILDFGCGTGDFADYMEKNKWTVTGVEPAASAREKAQKKLTNKVVASITELKEKYNFISLWHVLEHTTNPLETLSALKEQMTKEGFLIIALPNYLSYDARFYKEYWAAYDVPRHLWHFTKNSMYMLAAKLRLEVIEIYPMKFDAYYVSILSEKYLKNNKLSLKKILRAMKTGYISNQEAKKTGNYSSLIYVLKNANH